MKRILNRTILALAMLNIVVSAAYANEKSTFVLKNGSRIVGRIISQRPNKDITVKAENATFVIDDEQLISSTPKKTKYENLDRDLKRWVLVNKALKGDANGRYIVLYDIRTRTHNHHNLLKKESDESPKTVYMQIKPETYKLEWKNIARIEKTQTDNGGIKGLNDVVITLHGKTYTGKIVSQVPGVKLTIKTSDGRHDIYMSDIIETRKEVKEKGVTVRSQVAYTNVIVMKDKTTKEGIIVTQRYGKRDKDKYVVIMLGNGKKEKILSSKIEEYETTYVEKKKNEYDKHKMYVNEFSIKAAKTKTEGDKTFYIDRTVYPFPEGITITFKTLGAKLKANWHLVALDNMTMANGHRTQGFTKDTRHDNAIQPSTSDLIDGVSSISFVYLSPGYYALVNDSNDETYLIKITK